MVIARRDGHPYTLKNVGIQHEHHAAGIVGSQ
jgi:hypothetical protein